MTKKKMDDQEIESSLDSQEAKDHKSGKIGRLIIFGKGSFLGFKLLAPKTLVRLGEASTMRGQILARRIKIGKDSILSREDFFEKESDLGKVVEDDDGVKVVVNEIIILFEDGAMAQDLLDIANPFNLQATGFLPNLLMGKLEAQTETIDQLEALIDQIKNSSNPIIADVLPNTLIF